MRQCKSKATRLALNQAFIDCAQRPQRGLQRLRGRASRLDEWAFEAPTRSRKFDPCQSESPTLEERRSLIGSGRSVPLKFHRLRMPGNPVKFRDGCATVTGYKSSHATNALLSGSVLGRRRQGMKPESQDTGLPGARRKLSQHVFIPVLKRLNFSVKEKDEASPSACAARGR